MHKIHHVHEPPSHQYLFSLSPSEATYKSQITDFISSFILTSHFHYAKSEPPGLSPETCNPLCDPTALAQLSPSDRILELHPNILLPSCIPFAIE